MERVVGEEVLARKRRRRGAKKAGQGDDGVEEKGVRRRDGEGRKEKVRGTKVVRCESKEEWTG